MKELHICHVTVGHNPTDDRIFYKECSSLAKKYSFVTIVAPDKEKINLKKNRVSFQLFPEKSFFKNLKSAYKNAKRTNSDIFHIHEFELLPYFIWLKFRYNKKIIYDSHESIFHFFKEFSSKPFPFSLIIAIIAMIMELFFILFVDQVITVTPQIEKRLKPFSRKISILYNYPELSHFSTYSGINSRDNEPVLIYIGQIARARGIETIINSMNNVVTEFPKAKLLLIGNYQLNYKQYLDSLIEQENLTQNVKIEESVPFSNIPHILQKSTIGICSMVKSDFLEMAIQVKQFEYMLMGLPVIASRIPSTETYIENENAGLIADPPISTELGKNILVLLRNKKYSAKLGSNGNKAVNRKYNWGIMEKKLYEIYENL